MEFSGVKMQQILGVYEVFDDIVDLLKFLKKFDQKSQLTECLKFNQVFQ